MSSAIICDTTVWLYLGRIGSTELLQRLYETVYTTEAVCFELDVGRSLRADTINPRSLRWATVVSVSAEQLSVLPYNQLGPGEQSVLAYAYSEPLGRGHESVGYSPALSQS